MKARNATYISLGKSLPIAAETDSILRLAITTIDSPSLGGVLTGLYQRFHAENNPVEQAGLNACIDAVKAIGAARFGAQWTNWLAANDSGMSVAVPCIIGVREL